MSLSRTFDDALEELALVTRRYPDARSPTYSAAELEDVAALLARIDRSLAAYEASRGCIARGGS